MPTTVTVNPASVTLTALGETIRLTAEVRDQNGQVMVGAAVAWASSDASIATVDTSGLVTAVANGYVAITATSGSASGTGSVAVAQVESAADRAALVALYEATDGPNWTDNTNWLSDAPLREWYGVKTDASGRVVELDLSGWYDGLEEIGGGLQGYIPPELGNLSNLESLDLWLNSLTGTIPPELGKLANLKRLYLNSNRLTGVVAPELGRLAKLQALDLRDNALTGAIPPELGNLTALTHLRLDGNELDGQIPSQLASLVRLQRFDLGDNGLTGPIPPWLADFTGLTRLVLRGNDFTGPIPPELSGLPELGMLLLGRNNLSGSIPPELGNLDELWWLELQGNNLAGPIPPELGNLAKLELLQLAGNDLTGPVPAEIGNLENLRAINLENNRLTGSLPLNFVRLPNLSIVECSGTLGVCVPATHEFREWIRQVDFIRGTVTAPFCDEIDKQALQDFYDATNGGSWTRSDGWLEDEDLDRWHGVRIDSIGRVSGLDLSGNGLSGHVPAALERLVSLRELRIRNNALTGRLPQSLTGLELDEFDYANTSLCAADDVGFEAWLNGIPRHNGTGMQCPPLTEREVLESLYRNAGGRLWRRSTRWLSSAPLAEWHGVVANAAGRIVELRLGNNLLSGSIPPELRELSQLRFLDLAANDLSGSIPTGLADLGHLESLSLRANRLTGDIPPELGKLSELRVLDLGFNQLSGSIPTELSGLTRLERLDLGRNRLAGEVPQELARLANLSRLNLEINLLSGPVPPALGGLSGLVSLNLSWNQFSGSIPSELAEISAIETILLANNHLTGRILPELGALSRLSVLDLSGNQLAGAIPAALGGLTSLSELRFSGNDLSGSIPASLGALARLGVLDLANNKLSGPIPAEVGDFANLATLDLSENELSGPLPAELGQAAKLEDLILRDNELSGPVPPEFGKLNLLKSLVLADNPGLAGPLPEDITGLARLELLMAGGTGLCRPADARFDAWFGAIADRYLARCREGRDVYLTQTVQSWGDPVPLIAGEATLLRVFVTAPQDAAVTMPEVEATFYVDGAERHAVRIAASAQAIAHQVTEDDLKLSANAEIPDWVIVPGLEMVIEVDPGRTLDPALGVTKRIPESGRMAVDVRRVPPFKLTLIPILSETDPDSSVVQSVPDMAEDPDGHKLLRYVRTLLPVAEVEVTAREPVVVSTGIAREILGQVRAMRLMEGGSGHWMGVGYERRWLGGVADLNGWSSFSRPVADIMAHELGHNLSLRHAPCGSPRSLDPWFPHSGGSIGAWGYDFERNALVPPQTADLMGYCVLPNWISDFFFNKALDRRLAEDGATAAAIAAAADPVRTLLLWGGRDEDGVPYLDPAFVVDAVPSIPTTSGEYTIEGATADGTPIFSFYFDMPTIADGEGEETSFVFALPVQSHWANDLASITLSGPGGSAVLDEATDQPMVILRDPQSGEVRGFLRDPALAGTQVAADAVGGAVGQGMEMLFSRGIPGAEAWRR
ncbi:MAG: Ig-like domain-containing protein [Gemmatimonadota bacterium]|nr:Ig-like domain-containing protein [Gemmatimonadota bacterium]MDE2864140.1 Ig-like domain-containing protein [Gemmatimonadota bacterium]